MSSVCIATYRCFDPKADFQKKALSIAVGLTVGSWTELPETKKEQMRRHLGQVVSVAEHEDANTGERYADIRIAYPDINFSRDIPALLVTVFGKLSMDGKIKLLDLEFSESFLAGFPGPKFGIEGVRGLLGIKERPLLMSIFKSVIGYDLDGLREQFYQQALGGVDLIKDDEILFENPLTPIEQRVRVCMEAARQAESQTGKKLLYAVNLTGPTSKLASQAKKAIDAGANALLFNVLSYGFDALHELSADPEINIPIAAHPALAGALYPSPHYGIAASLLLGKLMRLAGADLALFPSPYGSVVMPKEENIAVKEALTTPDLPLRSSFPVPSAGIYPGLVPLIIRDFGTDVVVNAGGGIHGHPQGTAAGGRAFAQAIDATLNGVPLQQYAANYPELRAAIDAWGVKQ
ncbi:MULTISPECIES: 2,3-diketo-5-methylthiopentyl-1-phosphate enolase [unclassified Paenibacillus]|uniref:2,3-diketo-5-methylthiopentyl-1-phosphate enolase n=1 Tax=unclassified Paenibacillus TaxID=185978 RepID=UPI001C0FAF6C|nr:MULTISPECIES: 2,3-diketo-5-methylthiopentyl-1-phosphate enolase [unclassified Paenibacillus]MBU5444029.1 2,3-diketo-5-methylthiopentyl-1-phosphate enolase [Paenibacillus sp. MSJ-34]CAH0122230.1 2,3-diketo-5-methylthiopentyl-1-phosphate enolase [Paenibacillus sp. CECT 9249]